jgi:hypothetical protein
MIPKGLSRSSTGYAMDPVDISNVGHIPHLKMKERFHEALPDFLEN